MKLREYVHFLQLYLDDHGDHELWADAIKPGTRHENLLISEPSTGAVCRVHTDENFK